MKASREEVKEAQERLSPKRSKTEPLNKSQLQLLDQARVKAECLTGDANWDLFLQQLQHWVEVSQQQKVQFHQLLENPDISGDEAVKQIRTYLLLCNHRIEILEAVIGLPAQIKDAGEEAKLVLEKIGQEFINKNSQSS